MLKESSSNSLLSPKSKCDEDSYGYITMKLGVTLGGSISMNDTGLKTDNILFSSDKSIKFCTHKNEHLLCAYISLKNDNNVVPSDISHPSIWSFSFSTLTNILLPILL